MVFKVFGHGACFIVFTARGKLNDQPHEAC